MIYLPLYVQHGLGYSSLDTGLTLLAYTLPTLLVPPLAERLALRYRADAVIPAGLLVIGVGFLLMLWGSRVDAASWLTILPGCLLAGTGLGLTNTPVTNTTTGAVPGERAGMASSIDISARMISLSVNIALMGCILVAAIQSALRMQLPGGLDAATLRAMAEGLSAGKGAGALPRRRGEAGAGAGIWRRDAVWRRGRLPVRRGQLAGVWRRRTRQAAGLPVRE